MHVPQHYDLTKLYGQLGDRLRQRLTEGAVKCLGLGVLRGSRSMMDRLIELGGLALAPMPTEPGIAGTPYDRQHPGAHISPPVAVEVTNRPQEGFLDRILRVLLVAEKVACKRVRRIQVGKGGLLESGCCSCVQDSPAWAAIPGDALTETLSRNAQCAVASTGSTPAAEVNG